MIKWWAKGNNWGKLGLSEAVSNWVKRYIAVCLCILLNECTNIMSGWKVACKLPSNPSGNPHYLNWIYIAWGYRNYTIMNVFCIHIFILFPQPYFHSLGGSVQYWPLSLSTLIFFYTYFLMVLKCLRIIVKMLNLNLAQAILSCKFPNYPVPVPLLPCPCPTPHPLYPTSIGWGKLYFCFSLKKSFNMTHWLIKIIFFLTFQLLDFRKNVFITFLSCSLIAMLVWTLFK